ncbi:MAG: SAM-dependent methyltransferase [Bradyrhizobiaceae bacterium]|nr:MAG: SAM-dependent methyltransferase [Bradyrhizobiaceae bacterium]
MTPVLPAELKAALARKSEGLSQGDAARRAAAISENYRSGGTSKPIASETDALAYALARMPATYAAVTASLNALRDLFPDFCPRSLLDIGAGPGTASWAAAQTFDTLEKFSAIDANVALRALALDLASGTSLSSLDYERGDALTALAKAPPSDLVIASYVINELDDARREKLVGLMWEKAGQVLVVVEPGTPDGYQRIVAARAQLIASGAYIIAPCPHDKPCPLTPPDWCHFSRRLPRSRAHKHLKDADLPFEDERYIYVAASRSPRREHVARILSQPSVTKIAVSAKLCTDAGIRAVAIPRRDKISYAKSRKWNWGDAIGELAGE